MDFFKGVINTITQSDRKSQIKELCERVPAVHRIERGKYQLMLRCANADISSMLITVLDTFPNTKPILSVQGPLLHPWIDGYRFVTKCERLNKWEGAVSSLADIVLEVKTTLETGYNYNAKELPTPPKPERLIGGISSDYVNVNADAEKEEYNAAIEQDRAAEQQGASDSFPVQTPDVPSEFPKLKELSEAQVS